MSFILIRACACHAGSYPFLCAAYVDLAAELIDCFAQGLVHFARYVALVTSIGLSIAYHRACIAAPP
jgi:hypothetical protein